MKYIPPSRWLATILGVAGMGAAAGLAVDPIGHAAAAAGMHPSLGIMIAVNLLLPGAIVAGAVYYPRVRLVPVLAAAGLLGFTLSRMLVRDWRFWGWTAAFFSDVVHPIAVVAAAAGGVIAIVAALAVREARVVGRPPGACPRCGYPLAGGTCPECGLVQ